MDAAEGRTLYEALERFVEVADLWADDHPEEQDTYFDGYLGEMDVIRARAALRKGRPDG